MNVILTSNKIKANMNLLTWREVARECGKILLDLGKISEDFIEEMISTVEEYGPYVIILPGIALFHARPSSGVNETSLSLVTLKNEVIFDDFNNESIKCAFALAAIDSESHINLLSKLTVLLQNEKFLDLIKNNGSKEEMIKIINMI